jgi:hypothetical protein
MKDQKKPGYNARNPTHGKKTRFLSYNEAKAYLKPLGLKTKEDYYNWYSKNKPEFLPENPPEYYKERLDEINSYNTLCMQDHDPDDCFCDPDNPIHFYGLVNHYDEEVDLGDIEQLSENDQWIDYITDIYCPY